MYTLIERPGLRAPIKSWMPPEEIEEGAMQQLIDIAGHPEVGPHIAVMPDCHVGYGVPIGCVAPTIGAVIPNAVGVDIGCGLHAIQTGVHYDRERMDQRFWREWGGQVNRDIPTGFQSHKSPEPLGALDQSLRASSLQALVRERAAFQLGTLGGGNHFLEALVDEDDELWLMVHSGSRHTGLRIAEHYNQAAIESTERRRLVTAKDLASLPLDDPEGQDYMTDMGWAAEYALANRLLMGQRLHSAFRTMMERRKLDIGPDEPRRVINIHHNFARIEDYDGQSLVIHRKGATSAYDGEYGVIPGSMGTASYIVRGLGNEQSYRSCSHGAGRVMGRGAARREITSDVFAASLADTHSRASMSYVDEAPAAYKDIHVVIERQLDLIEVMHVLQPIMTVKGDSRARDD